MPNIDFANGSTSKPAPPGILTAALVSAVIVPQLGVGISVPSLPSIATEFQAPMSSAQGTLVVYMAGYALSVLVSGLLADRFGPRRVQVTGLAIAGAAALLASMAGSMATFYFARFLQALGGCVGTVTARLIVSGEYEPRDRMKVLTTLTSAIAITPCVTPLLGGALLPHVGWRGLFVVIALASFGALAFFLVASGSVTPHQRGKTRLSNVGRVYARSLQSLPFVFYATAIGMVWMSYFTFVSCSSGPLQVHMGLTPLQYGAVLALSTLGYVSGSVTARRLSGRHDVDQIIRVASYIGLSGGLVLIACTSLRPGSLTAIVIPVVGILFATGMTIPATQAGMLRHVTQDAGVASGFFFFIQMIAGAGYSGVGNLLDDLTPRILALAVALPAVLLPLVLRALTTRMNRARVSIDH